MREKPIPCPHCGSPIEPSWEPLAELLRTKDEQIKDLALEVARQRARAQRILSGRNEAAKRSPYMDEAWEVYNYWKQEISPRSREFSGKRLEAVIARLEANWTVDELKLAVDGAKKRPLKGKTTDLATICRDEQMVLMFLDFAGVSAKPREGGRHQSRTIMEEEALEAMQHALTEPMVERLGQLRGWTPKAIRSLGLGYDGKERRIVFPARDEVGRLVGVARYQPNAAKRGGAPKNLSEGARELFPQPELIPGKSVWLVEGEPDVVSMRSMGFHAVGVPGVATWKHKWSMRFARFDRVRICFDCDKQGRDAARERAKDLGELVKDVVLVDIDPNRWDGYDITDLLLEKGPEEAAMHLVRAAHGSLETRATKPVQRDLFTPDTPLERVRVALEARGLRVRQVGEGRLEAQCPVHDDRNPSLSISEGDDGRVLIHDHAGCSTEEIIAALGLEWKELFT